MPGTTDPWTECMLRGDFAGAWNVCDTVLRARAGHTCSELPRHQQWVWDGTSVEDKRVLVRCYHGLGDTIQFIRFARLVREIAREVIVWTQRPLIPLLATARGIDRLLPLHDGAPEVEYDVDIESMELGHLCRATAATLPAEVPYLHVASAALPPSGGRPRVGLVWSVSDWNHAERSIPLADLAPLLRVPGVEWHALQRGDALAGWPPNLGRVTGSDDVLRAAAVMRSLDLVITPDSFPAHLAGALGVQTWTLLPRDADWRWMAEREDSPWYPTMRLFRRQNGGWPDLAERVAQALVEFIAARPPLRHAG